MGPLIRPKVFRPQSCQYKSVSQISDLQFYSILVRGCSCCCCCCCDRGKTKSTLCSTWTELLSLDWSLTIYCLSKRFNWQRVVPILRSLPQHLHFCVPQSPINLFYLQNFDPASFADGLSNVWTSFQICFRQIECISIQSQEQKYDGILISKSSNKCSLVYQLLLLLSVVQGRVKQKSGTIH